MLALLIIWPLYFYPLVWLSLFFVFDGLNRWRGSVSLAEWLARGDWRPILALGAGGVTCGLFWELWNHHSYPKWVYHVPGVDFAFVFEMPLLGYLGYLPFSMELFLIRQLMLPGAETDPP